MRRKVNEDWQISSSRGAIIVGYGLAESRTVGPSGFCPWNWTPEIALVSRIVRQMHNLWMSAMGPFSRRKS